MTDLAQIGRLSELEEVQWLQVDLTGPWPVVHLDLVPPEPFQQAGFPTERVRLELKPPKKGGASVFPADDDRTWHHVYDDGSLCMWYPRDKPALRWVEHDGLEMLVRIVARHLIFEELFRRYGKWPVEEAPHRRRYRDTSPPLIRTPPMRAAARRRR